MLKKILILVVCAAVFGIGTFAVIGKIAPLSWNLWGDINEHAGTAISGFDVVAYHTDAMAIAGSENFESLWNGTKWRFANEKHKLMFDDDPARFAPQYGGFCAYAVLKNFSADINPEAWHIHNGKLYLFASENPKNEWVKQISGGSIEVSDSNWADRQ